MMKYIITIYLAIISIGTSTASELLGDKYDLWDSSGYRKVDWVQMDNGQKTFALERYRKNIKYCLSHLGGKFNEVEMGKVGSDKGFKIFTPVITHGLVATKYQDDYNNIRLAAKFYYKDWSEYARCNDERIKGIRLEGCFTFGLGPGDYNPLAFAVEKWKEAGMYAEALKHYDEYFEYSFLGRIRGPKGKKISKEEEIKKLKEVMKYDTELKSNYDNFIQEWQETKKLAKTEKPKPLDAAVQNHEWFYSDKQEEVLTALEYYHANKVYFMLEKALKHKDPVIAAKAKEYLADLNKGGGNGTRP